MSNAITEFLDQYKRDMTRLRQEAPDVVRGFGALFQAGMKDGALSAKHKELIALAISVAVRCEACIRLHAYKSLKVGATREEVLEAAGVAVVMQGGPSYTYLPLVLEVLDDSAGATQQAPAGQTS